jgi:hypothetical protein
MFSTVDLDDVRDLAMEHTSISPYMIHRRLRIPRTEAEIYLLHLEFEGCVGSPNPERSRPVLRHDIEETVPIRADVLKGDMAMTTPSAPSTVAIGACLSCRSLFLITPDTDRCLLCGRAPSHMLPFGLATPVDMIPEPVASEPTPEPPAPYVTIIYCPHCDELVELLVADMEVSVIPPSVAPLAEEPAAEVPSPVAADSSPGPSPETLPGLEVVPPALEEGAAVPDAVPSSPPVGSEYTPPSDFQ